jgi:hypothetical protein
MNFEAALNFLKAFSACNPRIYKEFAGFPDSSGQEAESGYVFFFHASLNKSHYFALKDFAQKNSLSIRPYGKFLMVSGSASKFC